MNQEQVEQRIKELLIELNTLREVINYENKLNEVEEEKDNEEIGESYQDKKIKFMRAYQNLPIRDLTKLYNQTFHTNYNQKTDGYLDGLRKRALNSVQTTNPVDKRKYNSRGVHSTNKEKFEKFKELLKQEPPLNNIQMGKELGVSSMTVSSWKNKALGKKPQPILRTSKSHRVDKSKIPEYVKIYFLGTNEEKSNLMKELNNITWSNLGKKVSKWKLKINPQSIGLSKFPTNSREYLNIKYLQLK